MKRMSGVFLCAAGLAMIMGLTGCAGKGSSASPVSSESETSIDTQLQTSEEAQPDTQSQTSLDTQEETEEVSVSKTGASAIDAETSVNVEVGAGHETEEETSEMSVSGYVIDETGEYSVSAPLGYVTKVSGTDWNAESYIPVIAGYSEALYAGSESKKFSHYTDGTYYEEIMLADEQTISYNTSWQTGSAPDNMELYIADAAASLSSESAVNIVIEQDDSISQKISYPVYHVTFITGTDEDTDSWDMIVFCTDTCTYVYGFCTDTESYEQMKPQFEEDYSGLVLYDKKMG